MEAMVDSVMLKDIASVDPDITVAKAAELMAEKKQDCLIVERNGIVVGIVTPSDIIEKVVAVSANPARVYVRDIMTTPVITIPSTASTIQAAELMSEYGVRKLPVVDKKGGLAGLFTSLELAKMLARTSDFQDPTLNALAKLKEGGSGPYR